MFLCQNVNVIKLFFGVVYANLGLTCVTNLAVSGGRRRRQGAKHPDGNDRH